MDKSGTILVTGAGGFIGGRIVEIFHQLGLGTIRAGVKSWAKAARVGRLPVQITPCNVLDRKQVDAAMRDINVVVHCVKDRPETGALGTQHLLESALEAGVERFVFLSSVAVYGDGSGEFDELAARPLGTGDYADSKICAEDLCLAFAKRRLPVTILRPTCVYGPFGDSWTTSYAKRVSAGHLRLSEADGGGRCNLLYVDDLVFAISLALERQEAVGEAFNVNGSPDEPLSWEGYLEVLAEELGLSENPELGLVGTKTRDLLIGPARRSADVLLAHMRAPLEALGRRSPLISDWMARTADLIYYSPDNAEIRMFRRDAYYSIKKAQRALGYQPSCSVQKGVALSIAWMRHHGLISSQKADP